jgi:ADP-heptose:LPS heptosyltransferase
MTTSAIRAYRKSFQHHEIICITGKSCEPVYTGNPHLDRLITFDDSSFYSRNPVTNLKETSSLIKKISSCKAERIFILSADKHLAAAAKNAGVPERFGFACCAKGVLTHVLKNYGDCHEVDSYIELCKLAKGFKPDGHSMNIYYNESNAERIKTLCGNIFDRKTVALAPGGRSFKRGTEKRRWPKYGELAKMIIDETDCSVLITGSHDDRKLVNTDILPSGRAVNICGKASLASSYAALCRCVLLVSNDSGALQLGAAAGIPVIGLFGSTSPINIYPVTNNLSRYFWASENAPDFEITGTASLAELSIEKVFHAVMKIIGSNEK